MSQKEIQERLAGPRPVAAFIPSEDVRVLFACSTSPDAYAQLILAKLKDAGAPIEGVLRLKPAHGRVFKMKDSVLEEQPGFTYLWLPDAYVDAMAANPQGWTA